MQQTSLRTQRDDYIFLWCSAELECSGISVSDLHLSAGSSDLRPTPATAVALDEQALLQPLAAVLPAQRPACVGLLPWLYDQDGLEVFESDKQA